MYQPSEFDGLDELLYVYLSSSLDNGVDVKDGKIQSSDNTQELVKRSLKGFYNSNQYRKSIALYLSNVTNLGKERESLYLKQSMSVGGVTESQKRVIAEHLSYLNESGLNERFNQPLRKLIYQAIGQGKSLTQLKETLKSYTIDPKVKTYFNQIAIQGADAYVSIVDQKITDKYFDRIKGYRMSGTIIETSSDQCIEAVDLGRELTKKEWSELLKKYKDKISEGTTVENLPTRKLHIGCRHSFTPYI